MSDERIAALRYFLDLDNPYLGVDQQRIMEGIAALNSLESQNQALQERAEKTEARLRLDRLHGMALQERIEELLTFIRSVGTPGWYETRDQLLSPTQETDPE